MKFNHLVALLFLSVFWFVSAEVSAQRITKGTLDFVAEYPSLPKFNESMITGDAARVAFYLDDNILANYLTLDSVRQWLTTGQFYPTSDMIVFTSDIEIFTNYQIAENVMKDIVVVIAKFNAVGPIGANPETSTRWEIKNSASAYFSPFSNHAPARIRKGTFIAFKLKEVSAPKIDYATSSLILNISGPKSGTYSLTNTQGNPVFKDRPEQGNVTSGRFEGGSLTLTNVVAGIYNLQVRADGYQTASKNGLIVDAKVSANSEDISLLAERVTTKLVVKTDTGAPVDRYEVRLTDLLTNTAQPYSGRSSSQEFDFALGKYEIEVKADGYQTEIKNLELTVDDIAVGKTIFVTLKKVGANARVQNVSIELHVIESGKNKEMTKYFLRIKDAKGNIVDSYPPSKTKKPPKIQLSPGTYSFEVELKGHYTAPQSVVVDGNLNKQNVTITMNKGSGEYTSTRRTGGKFWAFLVLAGAGGAYYLTQTTNGGDGYGTPPSLPTP